MIIDRFKLCLQSLPEKRDQEIKPIGLYSAVPSPTASSSKGNKYMMSKLSRKNKRKGYKKYQYKLKMELRSEEIDKIQQAEDDFNKTKALRKR
jgi:hypothetical protein